MSTENHYRRAGEQLDDDLEALRNRLYELEQSDAETDIDIESLADRIATILEERREAGDGDGGYGDDYGDRPGDDVGLSETQRQQVNEMLDEREAAMDPELKARLEVALDRLDTNIDDLESTLQRVVGPSPDELTSAYHSTPGWGIHFETDRPIRFGQATVHAFKSGYVNWELHRYHDIEGHSLGVVDSERIGIPDQGTHTITLDLEAPEEGHYVLTRDFDSSPPDDDRVAMRRTDVGYVGWESDSGDGLRFIRGVDVGGRWQSNNKWYYLGDLHVREV